MIACDYRVLEYAKTETQATGKNFLVVFRVSEWRSGIRVCLLKDWQRLAEVEGEFDLAYIEGLLHDLKLLEFRDWHAAEALFESIVELSSGPVRTGMAGSLEQVPNSLGAIFTGDTRIQTCSQQVFDDVISVLTREGRSSSPYF